MSMQMRDKAGTKRTICNEECGGPSVADGQLARPAFARTRSIPEDACLEL